MVKTFLFSQLRRETQHQINLITILFGNHSMNWTFYFNPLLIPFKYVWTVLSAQTYLWVFKFETTGTENKYVTLQKLQHLENLKLFLYKVFKVYY